MKHTEIAQSLHGLATDILNGARLADSDCVLIEEASASISSLVAQLEEARKLMTPMIHGTHWITPEQTEAVREFLSK